MDLKRCSNCTYLHQLPDAKHPHCAVSYPVPAMVPGSPELLGRALWPIITQPEATVCGCHGSKPSGGPF